MQLREVAIIAAGAILVGFIPTLALAWFGLWPHIPAALLTLLGLAAMVMKKSPKTLSSPKTARPKKAGLVQTIAPETKSHGVGMLLGVLALIPIGIWGTGGTRGEAAEPGSAGLSASAGYGTRPRQEVTPIKIVETDIDELSAVFRRNQIEGRQRFGNAPLKIFAEVVRVREALGIGILVLTSPDSGEILEVGFTSKDTPQLGAIMPGQSVIVTCPRAVEAMRSVLLSACSGVEVVE